MNKEKEIETVTLVVRRYCRGVHGTRLVRTTTCVDGCRCDYTICGDQDLYVKEHPEYRDEAGFRRNK